MRKHTAWGAFWLVLLTWWPRIGRSASWLHVGISMLALACAACASDAPRPKSANDCDRVEYLGDRPGYPLRLPSNSSILTNDYRPLPSSNEVPWLVDARAQKQWVAQVVTERSPWFGGAHARCPSTPELTTAEHIEQQAEQAGAEIGRKYGEVLGRIESSIQLLQSWPHNGVALKRILASPTDRDDFLTSIARTLDDLPDLPTYADAALARKALAGFQAGYKEGIASAQQRAFLIDMTVDVYFMVISGFAGALESAGAKLLDLSIMRLRAMPIFVPGATGGVGFFLKSLPRVVNGSSRRLLKNMLAAHKKPLKGEVPHHIVAHTDLRAERSREILKKFDIGVDENPNGVFLPQMTTSPNLHKKAVHATVHTNKYYEIVEIELRNATTKQEALRILADLGLRLEKGGL